ncbi:Type 1 phosphatases regulator ypi1 [Recurvomyces mirabilis]|uniref:Type 1 phosphatases regulator ypi1 n=1 Tax=Recurvomyces mirabilis TaxID=574656 RepID=UPI002DE1344B|nr:Type 1 phosphatases regulator ypi1 [Recurvomyces mirabilis]
MSQQPRTATRAANTALTSGPSTILQTNSQQPSATLRLRGDDRESATPEPPPRVRWAEDVVDNEGMGKKSSKVCCIYHKPKEPGDSESEDDSSSSSDNDSELDLSRARKAGAGKGRGKDGKGHECGHGADSGKGKGVERKPGPNAYERQPKHQHKKAG